MKAQALPDNFDIRRLLELQKQPIWVREATKLRSHTIDEAIPSRWVQVKDVANNKMAAPTMLESLLARIDREKDSVVLLSMNGPTRDTALVAVQPRSELMAMDAEKGARREKMKREGGAKKTKQIELNWAIGENDLELKMKKMEQLLGKGMRVEMLFANKKRQRRAEEAEAGATLARVRERIREIGATEKSLSGKVAQQATLMVELNEKIETKETKTSETQAAEA
jgi:translation initiation factor IF-3